MRLKKRKGFQDQTLQKTENNNRMEKIHQCNGKVF